jgi:EmrB/QacA subfamily drug resistance transporter
LTRIQYKWVALSVTTVGTVMAGVDARIVLVGLPTIAEQLHAGVADVIWVSQAYLFASTLGLLLIGRTTDLVGRVKIYNYGFIVFTVGSGLASLSFTSIELILSRMVQGVGASMIITNAAAILTDATPRNELGKILGMNSVAYRLGSITGLTLSGVILSITDWRALFYINIPIGIFGTVWAHYRLKEISTKDPYRGMDWVGFLTFAVGLGLILLSLTYLSFGLAGYVPGIGMLVVGAGLLSFFVRYELHGKMSVRPILDMKLFKIKEFAGGTIANLFNSIAWSGILVMCSFYLQVVVGYTPLQTGLTLIALDSTFIFSAPISGRLSDRYGSRSFMMVGLGISTVAFFLFALINAASDVSTVIFALALLGVGTGMWVSPNISSIMGAVPANRRGIASSFRITLSNVGDTLSFGLAVLLMTFVIPYGILNNLVDSYSIPGAVAVGKVQFIHGFELVAVVLASINTIAIFPASLAKKGRISPVVVEDEKVGSGKYVDKKYQD